MRSGARSAPRDPAVRCLEKDLFHCFHYFSFPKELWRTIRTTNILERAFREVRRRTFCRVGRADFLHDGRQTPALVVFGEGGTPALLGAMTLEGLGLGVDPSGKRLMPIDIPMATHPPVTQTAAPTPA